jgi:hypothetical protein
MRKLLCTADRLLFAAFALVLLPIASLVATAAEKIPGQRPLMIVGETFQFIPGAWGRYTILDKQRNESYRMYISILPREKKQKTGTSWMEIEVETRDTPKVVTRFLAEETPCGPGRLQKVIVQVQGYAPFNVPKKYFTGDDAQVSPVIPAQTLKRADKSLRPVAGRQVTAWEVEAEDAGGNRTRAIVSEEVPPIGIVAAENNDILMSLEDWGTGAVSRVSGTPRSFTVWILEQIAKEMGKQP